MQKLTPQYVKLKNILLNVCKKTGVQPIGQTEKAVHPFCVMGSVRKSIFLRALSLTSETILGVVYTFVYDKLHISIEM